MRSWISIALVLAAGCGTSAERDTTEATTDPSLLQCDPDDFERSIAPWSQPRD